ncbi:DUF2948 family protein [Paracoccus sp. R12_1]|jgi:hypothetical protein|uniref:DUF2948 family protein n=1 Tax=unclassified Paracoccus (in: a-proteobacteria) TaxID=2688777 RepID=UPI001ADADC62|nr:MULTISPECIES: DUF2948 family protein [unclassified Paracoccus (in: a-proteobacteria)]MBO9455697.1 DUF2948 family protein [Paracoccus sp. R12_2]MBO9486367.1 DUF2948 family protein [Paracoccus sp. R12_1]
MTEDARFRDADPRPLALLAVDEDDLKIMSTLVQDAILPASEISYDPKARRLALLVNRFRWEDADQARADGRPFERVRALLIVNDVQRLQSDGIDRDADTVLALLALTWRPGQDGTGRLLLDFAGDGTLAADAECINVELRDVTRPYFAPSGKAPAHPD